MGLEDLDVLVLEVLPGGQAEKVGLRKGDVVTSYAGERITALGRLIRLVAVNSAPDIDLSIRRDGQPIALKVGAGKLGARFEERANPIPSHVSR